MIGSCRSISTALSLIAAIPTGSVFVVSQAIRERAASWAETGIYSYPMPSKNAELCFLPEPFVRHARACAASIAL